MATGGEENTTTADTGNGVPPGLDAMVAALTGAFKNLSAPRGMPSVKLSKFRGCSGEPTIREWLDEFEEYSRLYKLQGREKAQVLVAHLAGAAKEEVMCAGLDVRDDFTKVRDILKVRFGKNESIQSLSAELYSRTQKSDESLADFSSALLRLYERMENAATGVEKEALKGLKDKTLKEQFIKGARDKQIQRELRRSTMNSEDKPFHTFRIEVLELFQDVEESNSTVRIRECEIGAARATNESPIINSMREEISQLKEALHEVVQAVQVRRPFSGSTARKPSCYNCGKQGHLKRDCQVPPKCFGCKQNGHYRRDCPREQKTDRMSNTANVLTIQDGSSQKIPSDIIGQSPTSIITIKGISTSCILDTGAEASLIPLSYYEQHLQAAIGGLDDTNGIVKVMGVSGTSIPIVGYLRAPVEVYGVSQEVGFLVVRDDTTSDRRNDHPIILGCNALRILLQDKRLEGKGEWCFVSRILHEGPKPVVSSSASTVLKTRDKVEIVPPLTIRRVICEMENASQWKGRGVLLEPIKDYKTTRQNPIELYEGYTKIEGPDVHVTVVNRSEEHQVIDPCTSMASMLEVELKEEVVLKQQNGIVEVMVADVAVEPGSIMSVNHIGGMKSSDEIQEGDIRQEKEKLPNGVDLVGLTSIESETITNLLSSYKDTFAENDMDLGYCDLIPHRITSREGPPIRLPYRRIPPSQIPEIKELLQEMLDKGIIQKSSSPYASPVVPIRKKDGSMRLCIDYRQLNARTIRDSFPLPRIEETLESLGGAQYFSSLDLANGYFQIAMDNDSQEKTAFRVPWGLFEFLRMPQGLVNSPSTFQRVMELIFGDLNLSQLVIYLDDILVFSSTLPEHVIRLRMVLERLRKFGLKLKGRKCKFLQREVHHLGHVVSSAGVAVDTEKIDRIRTWPTPTTCEELRSFLGLASYYRKFVSGFAKIAAPLHALVGKTQGPSKKQKRYHHVRSAVKFEWNPLAEQSFNELKEALTSAPVLGYPDFTKEFIVEIDASMKGLGACLAQKDDKGQLHPIAYASRGLRGAEKNYASHSSYKLELLALKWAITDKFRDYLMSGHTVILTDHNPLAYLGTSKLGATEQRWVSQLASFDLKVVYRTGRSNKCADALSRCPSNDVTEDIKTVLIRATKCSIIPKAIIENNTKNETSAEVQQQSVVKSVLPSFSIDQLRDMQSNDENLKVVKQCLESKWEPGEAIPSVSSEVKSYLRERDCLIENQGVLYRKTVVNGEEAMQLLVPTSLRKTIIESVHDKWGHQGVGRTIGLLRTRCFWPGLQNEVKDHIKRCFNCTVSKAPNPMVRTPMRHLLSFRPLEILAIDFLKLDRGRGGFENVLVMTDVYTKYAQAVPCKDQTAVVVARALRDHWFTHYGIPNRIHSDRGRDFEGKLIKQLCHLYGIHKSRTTPYHPEGNGQVERFNSTLCQMIRSMDPTDRKRWPEMIFHLIYMYNTTPHKSTGYSPYRLMYGREPTIPLDQLLPNTGNEWDEDYVKEQAVAMTKMDVLAKRNLESAAAYNKEIHDRRSKSTDLQIGQRVLLQKMAFTRRHKLEDKFYRDPYIITDMNQQSDVYQIRPIHGGQLKRVNRRMLKEDPRRDFNVTDLSWPVPNDETHREMHHKEVELSEEESEDGDFRYAMFSETEQEFQREQSLTDEIPVELRVDQPLVDDVPEDMVDQSHVEEIPQAGDESVVRRSERLTKGTHSNPFRMPISAIIR